MSLALEVSAVMLTPEKYILRNDFFSGVHDCLSSLVCSQVGGDNRNAFLLRERHDFCPPARSGSQDVSLRFWERKTD